MTPKLLRKTCLLIAGIASCAMAAFHFFLPHIFGWERFVGDIPSPIRWGLFSINVFFSSLLLWGGIATIVTTLKHKESDLLGHCIIVGMGIFWVIDTSYQVIIPFPVAIMRWVLLAFALTVALLYIFSEVLSLNGAVAKDRV